MRNILAIIIFFYFLSLIQTSFLVPFNVSGKLPNLILVFVIYFVLLENPKENFGFFTAFVGGFYIDIFSSHPLGTTTIFLLVLTFLLKKLSSSLKNMTIFWFSLFSFGALVVYNAFSQLASGFSQFPFSFRVLLSVELIYNFILILAIFYLFSFLKKYVPFLVSKIS